jgi:hypothetical protein
LKNKNHSNKFPPKIILSPGKPNSFKPLSSLPRKKPKQSQSKMKTSHFKIPRSKIKLNNFKPNLNSSKVDTRHLPPPQIVLKNKKKPKFQGFNIKKKNSKQLTKPKILNLNVSNSCMKFRKKPGKK